MKNFYCRVGVVAVLLGALAFLIPAFAKGGGGGGGGGGGKNKDSADSVGISKTPV
jgi:hypothetical protein